MGVGAAAELLSLGALLPFLAVLVSPEQIMRHELLWSIVRRAGINSAQELVLPMTIGFILAALFAGAVRVLILWANTRIAFAAGVDLSTGVYLRILHQPYSEQVARNSSEATAAIANKVGATIYVLFQTLAFINAGAVFCVVTVALFVIDPVVASFAVFGFGLSYGAITMVVRGRLTQYGQRIAVEETRLFKAIQEGLGGIRDVILDGTQYYYGEMYRRADVMVRRANGNIIFLSGSPRFAMEAMGMALIALLAFWMGQREGGIAAALPVLGALALGAQRLLPALQQCYVAWSGITGSRPSVLEVLKILDQPLPAHPLPSAVSPMRFSQEVRFDAVSFRYGNETPWVLNKINLVIPKGGRIGIIGSTGSGKSTLMDIFMGLLDPAEGRVVVDGQPIESANKRAWQLSIAHVPQSIFLADTSIAENIAFGVAADAIDLERVKWAAEQAQIGGFIDDLPEKYDTRVGERGVRLSGGQRQRIGIARALYKRAEVLVFDEATSALDNTTEEAVMDELDGLGRDLTIFIIAHRLTTLRRCDQVVELTAGNITAQGTYEAIIGQRSAA